MIQPFDHSIRLGMIGTCKFLYCSSCLNHSSTNLGDNSVPRLIKRCDDTPISVYNHQLFSKHSLVLFSHLSSSHSFCVSTKQIYYQKDINVTILRFRQGPNKSNDTICPGRLGSGRETNGHRMVLRTLFVA